MSKTDTETAVDRDRQAALDVLAEIGGKLTAEEDVIFKGRKLVIPENMELRDAIRFLRDKEAEDEESMMFARTFNYRPWDGARATQAAFRRAFGMMRQKASMGMFGPNPPQLRSIPVSVDEEEQVPWGNVTIPMLKGATFTLGAVRDPEMGQMFSLSCEAPRKFRFHIEGVFNLVRDELANNSMYRGKAFDGQEMPKFLDLAGVNPEQVIYSDDVVTQLEANVWTLLRHTARLRELGTPLKRAVLFEGPYGTGKTLAAYLTARLCVENGWTFVYCRPGRDDLRDVMATAQLYQPAVVFFEDVDVVGEKGDADAVSDLLDIFDGIQAKGTEIVAVLTTNHVERIHKGMMRPGRLDAVIHVGALDPAGIRRLVEATVPSDLLDTEIDWAAVAESMEGYVPAFCREATDRAVRYNLARNGGEVTRLSTADFVDAATGLRPQFALMEGAGEGTRSDGLGAALARTVEGAVDGVKVVRAGSDPDDAWAALVAPEAGLVGR